jgi:hypothetical protein
VIEITNYSILPLSGSPRAGVTFGRAARYVGISGISPDEGRGLGSFRFIQMKVPGPHLSQGLR